MNIKIERVYTYLKRRRQPDEYVVLVDRLWPRGVKKASLDIDEHLADLGPAHELRKWFNHEPERWDLFREKYEAEIDKSAEKRSMLEKLKAIANQKNLTLLYSAKNEHHNQAQALLEIIVK